MNKYHAKKVTKYGITFDSFAECRYYEKLLELENEGEINSFNRQVSYILQDGFSKNGIEYKPITYIADFVVVLNTGEVRIIDVKGYETDIFKLKKKLFELKYLPRIICLKYDEKKDSFVDLYGYKREQSKKKREKNKLIKKGEKLIIQTLKNNPQAKKSELSKITGLTLYQVNKILTKLSK